MATLIKPEEVVNNGIVRPAPLTARFDEQLIAAHIQVAEEKHIVPVLGRDFYDALVAAQNTSACNYLPPLPLVDKFPSDPLYETLWVGYLYQLVARAVYLTSLPYIALQTGANGIYLNNSEYSQNAGVQGVKMLQDTERDNVLSMRQATLDFLCRNYTDYPLFDADENCETCNQVEQAKKSRTKSNFGFIF